MRFELTVGGVFFQPSIGNGGVLLTFFIWLVVRWLIFGAWQSQSEVWRILRILSQKHISINSKWHNVLFKEWIAPCFKFDSLTWMTWMVIQSNSFLWKLPSPLYSVKYCSLCFLPWGYLIFCRYFMWTCFESNCYLSLESKQLPRDSVLWVCKSVAIFM